jgi:dinuclear metal center YbgI/SA1388 family protein
MEIRQIITCLETRAPLCYQEGYDNAGLLTGDPGWEVSGALLTLDVTEAVIREAIEKKCNLVISHHPLIFRGLKKLTGRNHVERAVILAIKNDIALYAAHTNLDNMRQGVNDMIAEKLGLTRRRVLSPSKGTLRKLYTFAPRGKDTQRVLDALFAAGAGFIGGYSECSFSHPGTGSFKAGPGTHPYVGQPGIRHLEEESKIEVIFPAHLEARVLQALHEAHPYEEVAYDVVQLANPHPGIGSGLVGELPEPMPEAEFLQQVRRTMGAEGLRHTALLGRPVQKVAVCGGAGSFLLPAAIASGAGMFLSADFKYHEFFDADNQIVIADIGHFESEQYTVEIFYNIITEKIPNFAPLKSNIRTNPINYLH